MNAPIINNGGHIQVAGRRRLTPRTRALRARTVNTRRILKEADGVLGMMVLSRADILSNPWFVKVVREGMLQAMALGPPRCMCCRHGWSKEHPLVPAKFVIAAAAEIDKPEHAAVFGLCELCSVHPDRQKRIDEALKVLCPTIRPLDHAHPQPGGVQ